MLVRTEARLHISAGLPYIFWPKKFLTATKPQNSIISCTPSPPSFGIFEAKYSIRAVF